MSVRPTQTKSGYPRRSRQPYPTSEQDPVPAETDPAQTTSVVPTPVAPPEPVSRIDRRSQRAARRTRRNLAIVCGLVVAVCLVLTILIVNMARTRTSGADTLPRSLPSSLGRPAAPAPLSIVPIRQTRDAPASEGGNP
jgi:hypothetical protein